MADVIPVVISSRSLGTSTTATTLSGDQSGNAANYPVPNWAAVIGQVHPFITELTPTAGQTVFASLIPSAVGGAVAVGFYEVPATPLGSVLGATGTFLQGLGQNFHIFPFEFPWMLGSANPIGTSQIAGVFLQFQGQVQIANTVAPRMGAVLYVGASAQDFIPRFGTGLWQSLWTSIGQSSSNPVSTGTSAGAVNNTAFTAIPGPGLIKLRRAYLAITSGTIVASDTTIGFSTISANVLPRSLNVGTDPITGFLGTTGQVQNPISWTAPIYEEVKTPVTFNNSLTLDVAPANAGKFEEGLMYTY